MASVFADQTMEEGLDFADVNGTRIDITNALATDFTEATSTFSLGQKTGLNTGVPEDGATDGRRVIVPAITDGTVDLSGTATHWALTDGATLFIASQTLTGSVAVTSGNTFTLDAISITIRDST